MRVFRSVIAVVVTLSGVLEAGELAQATSVSQPEPSRVSEGNAASSKLPRFSKLESKVHHLLRQHAASKTAADKLANTLPLIRAAHGLRADPRFSTSPTLQSMRGRLFARLRTVKKNTIKQLRRHKKNPTTIEIDQQVLAQLNQAAANPNANQQNALGGAAGPGNGVGLADYGPQLIDLIQRTISPSSWTVNGGASSISYWRPGMALVVRAPESLHREFNPLLKQLRQQ